MWCSTMFWDGNKYIELKKKLIEIELRNWGWNVLLENTEYWVKNSAFWDTKWWGAYCMQFGVNM